MFRKVSTAFLALSLSAALAHAQTPPSPTPSAQPDSPQQTIDTRSIPDGTYLTNGSGQSLYLFEGDEDNKSNCVGSCASVWIPFTVLSGEAPTVSGEAQSGLVGLIQRDDGSTQVTYDEQPLYLYRFDANPGDTFGRDLTSFGDEWQLVRPDGDSL